MGRAVAGERSVIAGSALLLSPTRKTVGARAGLRRSAANHKKVPRPSTWVLVWLPERRPKLKSITTLAVVGAVTLAFGGTVAASTTSTSTDVTTLANAEAHYTSVLRAYASTSVWLSEYKTALAVVTADQAKVSADLAGSTTSPATGPAYVFTGQSGAIEATTRPFNLRAGLRNWSVNWSLSSCLSGIGNEFSVNIAAGPYGTNMDAPFSPPGINLLNLPAAPLPAARSHGTQVFATNPGSSSAGTFHFVVSSTCDFTMDLYV